MDLLVVGYVTHPTNSFFKYRGVGSIWYLINHIQESTETTTQSWADLCTMLANIVSNKLLSFSLHDKWSSYTNKRMASVPTLTSDQSEDFAKDYVIITRGEAPLKVFIAGKVGTGKSSLVSTITGRKVAGEGSLTTSIIYRNGQILAT